MHNKTLLPLSISLCLISGVQAADTAAPVVVTATRTAQTADETLASVSVVSREDIERTQARSILDLLRGLPGVGMTNNGGPGKATSLFLRGTSSEHVLVMLDGIRIGSATLGTTAFQDIPVDQIERIELVRGPRSSLYGSDAIGGVIQIFTRKGGDKFAPNLSIGAGSYNTKNLSAGVSDGNGRYWYSAQFTGEDTEGFNSCRGSLSAGCFTIEPDDDGYRNLSVALRGGTRLGDSATLEAHLLRTDSESEFDGGFQNQNEGNQQVLGATLDISATDSWQSRLSIGQSQDRSDNFLNGSFTGRFNSKRTTASWQNDIHTGGESLLTLGVDYYDDKVDSTTAYSRTSRDNLGLYAQYQNMLNRHNILLSLRSDDNEQFGTNTTGNIGWGYRLDNGMRLTASFGSAFNAPTFNQLYWPGFGVATLNAEESDSLEAGVAGSANWGQWQVNLYQTKIDNMIAYDSTAFSLGNINQARIRGLEATINTQLSGWAINGSLTLQDPQDSSGGSNDGNQLVRRAKQSLRLDIDRPFDNVMVGATLFAEGKRYDDLANTNKLSGYALVDVRAEYRFDKRWRLAGKIGNLFDNAYETAGNYFQADRNYMVSLRYQP